MRITLETLCGCSRDMIISDDPPMTIHIPLRVRPVLAVKHLCDEAPYPWLRQRTFKLDRFVEMPFGMTQAVYIEEQ